MSSSSLQRRIRNHALRYLKSRVTTVGHLRTLLVRGARKRDPEADPEEIRRAANTVLDELVRIGALDDHAWAESRVRSLLQKGNSTRQIRAKLHEKRVPPAIVDELLSGLGASQDLLAALTYLRKRRLGPWASEPDPQRTMAKLGRRGFSWDIARRAVEMDPDEARDITGT